MRVSKFHQWTQTSVLADFLFSSFSCAYFKFYLDLHMYKQLKSLVEYPICLKTI